MTSSELQDEIVNRHIGWEVCGAYYFRNYDDKDIELVVPAASQLEVMDLLSRPLKPSSALLPSHELALLGAAFTRYPSTFEE